MKSVVTRYKILAGLAFFCLGAFLIRCSDKATGPVNAGPVIDTIYSSPDSVLPGAKTVLSALVTEPDGDSLIYRWSTYPAAGRFSDTTSPVCTMTVAPALVGGMFLKVTLRVSDGKNVTTRDRWIALIEGELVRGNVYYNGTKMPIPFVEVSIGSLVDTNRYSDGYYSISHIPTGTHTIHARLLACDTCCNDYAADIVSIGIDTLDHTINMNCDDYLHTVHGLVKSAVLHGDTTKLENVKVTLINDDGTETGLCDTTDANGEFTINGVPAGFRGFAVEDAGNPIYEVFPDIGWFVIPRADNKDAVISVEVKRTFDISEGVSDTTVWVLADDYLIKRWYVDTVNQCYTFNTCTDGNYGKIKMANTVPIPYKAKNIIVTVDFDLYNALMYVGFISDGSEAQYQFFEGTTDRVFEIDAEEALANPAGHNMGVSFYIQAANSDPCGSACLRSMKISYILPRY